MNNFDLKKYLAEGRLNEGYSSSTVMAVRKLLTDDFIESIENSAGIKIQDKGFDMLDNFFLDFISKHKESIDEGLFGKEVPQDVKAEKYKGYPKELNAQYFTVDADGREYDEERYIADESEGWGKDKVFALASDDEYYIFKLGSKEHIENYNSKSFDHLTKVSERAFKRFLKKFN